MISPCICFWKLLSNNWWHLMAAAASSSACSRLCNIPGHYNIWRCRHVVTSQCTWLGCCWFVVVMSLKITTINTGDGAVMNGQCHNSTEQTVASQNDWPSELSLDWCAVLSTCHVTARHVRKTHDPTAGHTIELWKALPIKDWEDVKKKKTAADITVGWPAVVDRTLRIRRIRLGSVARWRTSVAQMADDDEA